MGKSDEVNKSLNSISTSRTRGDLKIRSTSKKLNLIRLSHQQALSIDDEGNHTPRLTKPRN